MGDGVLYPLTVFLSSMAKRLLTCVSSRHVMCAKIISKSTLKSTLNLEKVIVFEC